MNIKDIRNRIAHHETIFNKKIDKTKNNILLILKIYSNDLYRWSLELINEKIFRELDNLYHQPSPEPTDIL